jgi:hypothetical protein
MTVYAIIHTTVDDTETHHREIVPKIMRAVVPAFSSGSARS